MTVKKRDGKRIPKHAQEEIEEYLFDSNNITAKKVSDIKFNKKFKTEKQKHLFNKIIDNRIIFVRGTAGTGKTYIALMAALECLINSDYAINKIALTKPIVEVSKSLGALPGDEKEKTMIYFSHFYDNFEKLLKNKSDMKLLKENNCVTETILNYIRGNTFGSYDTNGNPIGSVCILDEAQNTTVNEIKTFISRMGENTKLIICGDSDQVDIKLKYDEKNGFDFCWDILQDMENIDFMEFTEDDIVREKLLIDIMKRFKMHC